VLAFMSSKGLADERNLMLRLPFRKEEKYVFRAPAKNGDPAASDAPTVETTAANHN
jgi:hypothetical protein